MLFYFCGFSLGKLLISFQVILISIIRYVKINQILPAAWNFQPTTLLKKSPGPRCFLVSFVKFQKHLSLRTPPGDCF